MAFSVELLQPFLGYLDLRMFQEANDELESLPNQYKTRPEVLGPGGLGTLCALYRGAIETFFGTGDK